MGTNTARLQLFKPADTDFADQVLDLNNNLDKLDAAFPQTVRYYKSVGQIALAQATVTAVKYDVADRTDATLVTASANQDVFTLNKTGWWEIHGSARMFSSGATTNPAEGFIVISNVAGNNTVRYGTANSYSSASPNTFQLQCHAKRFFTAGSNICVNTIINGMAGSWDLNTNAASESIFITFTYEGAA